MYIIIGLGNPTRKYKNTRHNIGFDALDYIGEKNSISISTGKFKSLYGAGLIAGEKVVLLKPLTFMNLSGEAVRAAIDFYKIDPEKECIVIYDDVSLDVGQIRIRKKGSAGGHNGMKSIIDHLGTQNFTRIRLGIGKKPEKIDLANYVLGRFDEIEQVEIDKSYVDIEKAIVTIINEDVDRAMSIFNRVNKEPKEVED